MALLEIKLPHTGEELSKEVNSYLKRWDIDPKNIILVVTDNGANIEKSKRLLKENMNEHEEEVIMTKMLKMKKNLSKKNNLIPTVRIQLTFKL